MELRMGIVKLEINIEEATKAIEAFKTNRLQAFESLHQQVKEITGNIVNKLLHSEMTLFLGEPTQVNNKRNGYYEREYAIKGLGSIRIKMPIDRKREFASQIIPKNEQIDPTIKKDLALLHLAGLSTRNLSLLSQRLFGIQISKDTVTQSLPLIKDQAMSFLSRPLVEPYWALYIDGTNFHVQRRGSTEREPSLVVLGINARNHLSILAIEPGSKENVESWRATFDSVMKRGLNPRLVQLGIMDGLPGLENAFKETFQSAVTQRCWVHAKRNAVAKTPARLREPFEQYLQKVMYAPSAEQARIAFNQFKQLMGQDAHKAVLCIEKDLDALLAHYHFDSRLWTMLKTTNPIERVNREFKRRTKSMDTIGEMHLGLLQAFTAIRLEYNWRKLDIGSYNINNLLKHKGVDIDTNVDDLIH